MHNEDPYLYDDVPVLINKIGIKKEEELGAFEADAITGRIVTLRHQGFKIHSVFDIKKIHKFIFEPVFEWAGNARTIDIFKSEKILNGMSGSYTPCEYIDEELRDLDKKFQKISWNSLADFEKIPYIVDIIQELWQIHSFREGNTRTVALFLYFLIKQNGLHMNAKFLGENSMYFRNSLVLSSIGFYSKKEYLIGIIEDCVSLEEPDSNKYKTIDGESCEKYDSRQHTIEKLKTIKSFKDLEK